MMMIMTFVQATVRHNVTLSVLYTLTPLLPSYLKVKCPRSCARDDTNAITNNLHINKEQTKK
jgi:hypothetical protein